MDYRIGITGAQGSGKTTLARYIDAHYGIPYVDAGVGKLMSSLGVKVGERLPLYERLQVQMEIVRHIEMITRGVEGFVIDRTPADVMAYTLDLVGQTNEGAASSWLSTLSSFAAKRPFPTSMLSRVFATALSFPAKISRVPARSLDVSMLLASMRLCATGGEKSAHFPKPAICRCSLSLKSVARLKREPDRYCECWTELLKTSSAV
ncbi:AAA family ATPase [Klebsiella pneumoniae]|uniref:AAA family ATPase n=1 Tax=Klebsiella pneumoniae TaxID=573 RepID=UPI002949EFA8|nr:AAA family ATPase [Klebsiella pneumoniae]MDV5678127.1 AAA family ATPase [Klebsiella pneumoniae]